MPRRKQRMKSAPRPFKEDKVDPLTAIVTHPQRVNFEYDLAAGVSVEQIARAYHLSLVILKRYRVEYLKQHPQVVARLTEPQRIVDDSVESLRFGRPEPDEEDEEETSGTEPEIKITQYTKILFREFLLSHGISIPTDPEKYNQAIRRWAKERRRQRLEGEGQAFRTSRLDGVRGHSSFGLQGSVLPRVRYLSL